MLSRRSLSGDRDSARAKLEPMALAHHPNWRVGSTTALGGMTGAGAASGVEWVGHACFPEVPRTTGQASAGEESVLAEL